MVLTGTVNLPISLSFTFPKKPFLLVWYRVIATSGAKSSFQSNSTVKLISSFQNGNLPL